MVDELLQKKEPAEGAFVEEAPAPAEAQEPVEATCACGSGIPIQKVAVDGKKSRRRAALIFQQFREAGKAPEDGIVRELLETVKVYNPIPGEAEEAYAAALLREYTIFCQKQGVSA
jgi:hypothetical protein